jgi:hypothetical protein
MTEEHTTLERWLAEFGLSTDPVYDGPPAACPFCNRSGEVRPAA